MGRRVLLHVFSTFDIGGPQTRFATIGNRLAERYRHLILAMDNKHGAAALLGPDVDHGLLPLRLDKGQTWRNLPAFRRMIVESGAERLITYNWGACEWGLANRFGGIPHVHIEDGFGPEETNRQLRRRVWFRRLALARAHPIVLPSRKLESIALNTWRFPASQVAYVPNGVDCDRFDRPPDPELCAALGIAGRSPIIGTVAGLRPEKNVGRLVRAFAIASRTHAAHLVIVGAGPERPALEQLARELGVAATVTFVGQLHGVERLLGAFDVYAISSDTEQMPISLIEAMAAKLPVAAVDVGDVAVMVAPENRRFVVPVEERALAGALESLLGDAPTRKRIGAANASRARAEFAEDKMIAAYDSLYSGRW